MKGNSGLDSDCLVVLVREVSQEPDFLRGKTRGLFVKPFQRVSVTRISFEKTTLVDVMAKSLSIIVFDACFLCYIFGFDSGIKLWSMQLTSLSLSIVKSGNKTSSGRHLSLTR